MLGKTKRPQTNKSNTTSCAALENLIKSTSRSVNFGVWIQNVYRYYLRRWLVRDVQHCRNPCVSSIRMSGALSSVATALPAAGLPPLWLSVSASPSLTELRLPAERACSFVFLFPETDPHLLSVFQASWKDKKTYKTGSWCLIWRVLRARSIYFKPFIYAARKEQNQKNWNIYA